MGLKKMKGTYQNSREVANLGGTPLYMNDVVDSCLTGRLNLFLQGDTGAGKTQLARDAMGYFPGKSLFVLGRNDMDTRELFQQINLEKLKTAKSSEDLKEVTSKVNNHLIVVDELSNCVPAVRAQLFNLFDGYIEINGVPYPIGKGYSVGIATGNIGQRFTEASNQLGRALRDRMHVIVDVDYFYPKSSDTLDVLAGNQNPRVEFGQDSEDKSEEVISKHRNLISKPVPLEKLIIANYLIHGLDYCGKGSKRKMKDAWPTQLDSREQAGDFGLVLPISTRAAKSIIRLSQAFDEISKEKGGKPESFESMMQAYRLVSAYSGVLNEAAIQNTYNGDNYSAMDAVITTTKQQFDGQKDNIAAGFEMASRGEKDKRVLDKFGGRWGFMKDTLE
ncbi:AAA family ATPase [Candidatus Pacearchaeota archaeon]|nr:AAA family ATPase [Candidatus Pacearchaeota archaeon]